MKKTTHWGRHLRDAGPATLEACRQMEEMAKLICRLQKELVKQERTFLACAEFRWGQQEIDRAKRAAGIEVPSRNGQDVGPKPEAV
jgi:hypothetical protein